MNKSLSPGQTLVLRAVAVGHSKCNGVAIHARMGERNASMTLRRLSDAGLLSKARDLTHKTHFVYRLTPAGKEALA